MSGGARLSPLTVKRGAVLITMVDSLLGFLMVITLVSSKLSQALQIKKKKKAFLPLSQNTEGCGRPYHKRIPVVLPAIQIKKKKKAAVLERTYNTILKRWQQLIAAEIQQKTGKKKK